MSQPPPSDHNDEPQESTTDQDTPAGAIVITLFLAATILVFWFGMFFLNLQRS